MYISRNGWLRFPLPKAEASARLFCFPALGAEAFVYDAWAGQMPDNIEVCSIQLPRPGIEPESKRYEDLKVMIKELAETIRQETRSGQKIIFYGYCLGTFWAYEVARYLREEADIQIDQLIVAGFPAPHLRTKMTTQARTPEFIELMTGYFPAGSPLNAYVLTRVPAMLKDAEIAEQDSPPLETPFHCPITVFGGWQDQIANPEDFQSWQAYTDGPFELRMFEGDHFFTERQPEVFLQAFLNSLQAYAL